ncbi:hypothetical protein ACQPZP_14500 [Spirillospora sp. CA-142024]|uniref:hypothetical protein n=1 Tax=Spirillospora sp. CA-142024 TaxID=3240036 RepID=UPI003D925C06
MTQQDNPEPVVRTVEAGGHQHEVMSLADFATFIGQDPDAVRAEYDLQQAMNPGAPFRMPHAWLQEARRRAKATAARLGTYDAAAHIADAFPGRRLVEEETP